MIARGMYLDHQPPQPEGPARVVILVNGESVTGFEGQSIAGVLLGSGRLAWRVTARSRRPRGLFCGIGVCFDCLVTVNGIPDVRACQRRAHEGDVVVLYDQPPLPDARAVR